ncbi:phosphatase PAP2 family protein [Streptomyces sp. M10(2022)]
MPTLVAGMAVIAAVTLVRRCWWQAARHSRSWGHSRGNAGAPKTAPSRPGRCSAEPHRGQFPSGHVAIVAGLALGAVLVASPRIRPYVATAGMLWLAVTAAAVQTLYWHRPSDAIGATLLACACCHLAARLLPADATPGITWRPAHCRSLPWPSRQPVPLPPVHARTPSCARWSSPRRPSCARSCSGRRQPALQPRQVSNRSVTPQSSQAPRGDVAYSGSNERVTAHRETTFSSATAAPRSHPALHVRSFSYTGTGP